MHPYTPFYFLNITYITARRRTSTLPAMEKPFGADEWQPTGPPESGETEITDLPQLIAALNEQTDEIYRHPYDPECWLKRAGTLTSLRYPELAVGDAIKAGMLCDALLNRINGREYRLGHRMGFCMREDSDNEAMREAEEDLEKRLRDVGSDARRMGRESLYHYPTHLEGRYMKRPYPWMEPRHQRRGEEVVEKLNWEFVEQAVGLGRPEADCVVQRHAFGESNDGGKASSDVLGVFATRDIGNNTKVVVDTTAAFGCIGPGLHGSRANLHGGAGCTDPIHPNLEMETGTLDMRWIRDELGSDAAFVILRCRLLVLGIEAGIAHPLDHPLLARLTPTYRKDKVRTFHLKSDIQIPNECLQRFGIDIFANPAYDTWVLFTVLGREANNSWSDPIHSCISPLFSLFNHSCEPNVEWHAEGHAKMVMTTIRDVQAGEQLFVRYDGYLENQPLQARRRRLKKWLDAECQCSRCVREEAEHARTCHVAAANGAVIGNW